MARILHLTEALGGGVLHCVRLLANEQARVGHEVSVVHSVRSDTPSVEALDASFDVAVKRKVLPMRTELGIADLISFVRIVRLLSAGRFDAIHLHSSKAGALGRMAAFVLRCSDRVHYSPHGFAFFRQDIGARKRLFFLAVERMLSRLGGKVLGCSQSERRYASRALRSRHVHLLENGIDLAPVLAMSAVPHREEPIRIATSGRITYPKAPWRYAVVARAIARAWPVEFLWLGDGNESQCKEWLDSSPILISGWLDEPTLLHQLSQTQVFMMTSLWEAMPIALIEAQAMGIPAVVTSVCGNRDIVVHGRTGFVARTDEALIEYTKVLLSDAVLRREMGHAAREHARSRFGKERFVRRSLQLYFGETAS